MTGELSHIRAVLFDFDDTLADTYPGREAGLRRAFFEAGITNPTAEDFLHEVNGRTFDAALAEIEEAQGANLRLVQRYRRAYWAHEADNASVFDGVVPMLEGIRNAGLALALVTSKLGDYQLGGKLLGDRYQMGLAGLNSYFSVTVMAEDVTEHKPRPEAILLALARLNVVPEYALMVGDSSSDWGAAYATGCWCCHAKWAGYSTGPAIEGVEPHYEAHDPGGVLKLLGVG